MTNQKLGAEVSKVDFTNSISAAGIINNWVSEKTDGLVNEIISPDMIDADLTFMTLVTAILFKGKWIKKFVDSGEGIFYKKSLDNESMDKESFEEAIRSDYFFVRTNFMKLRERNLFGYYKDRVNSDDDDDDSDDDENKTQVRVHRIVQCHCNSGCSLFDYSGCSNSKRFKIRRIA